MTNLENEVAPVKFSKREIINKLVARMLKSTEITKEFKESIELDTLKDYRGFTDIAFTKAMEDHGLFLSPLGKNKFYLMLVN